MKKSMGLGALLLAGLLVIPGNLWLPGQALIKDDYREAISRITAEAARGI